MQILRTLKYLKREAVNAILNTKNLKYFTLMNPAYHTFLMVTKNYHCKVTLISALHTEKIAESLSVESLDIGL